MDIPNIPYKVLFREEYMIKHFPEFVSFIRNKYPTISTYKEMIYLFINNMDEPPICPTCGQYKKYRNSPAGYGLYCNRVCVNNKIKSQKSKSTKLERYGNENYNNREKIIKTNIEKYGYPCTLCSPKIKEKSHKTNIEKYGVDNPFKSPEIQQKIIETRKNKDQNHIEKIKEKYRQTCMDKYGVDNPMKSPKVQSKFKSTMLKKYGVEYAMLSEELNKKCSDSIAKAHRTGKYIVTHNKNNSFNTSKIEEQFRQYLTDNNISFISQFLDDKYPYQCDFYIPEYKLYIEIQGTWTHGGHPFDPKNKNDIKFS